MEAKYGSEKQEEEEAGKMTIVEEEIKKISEVEGVGLL